MADATEDLIRAPLNSTSASPSPLHATQNSTNNASDSDSEAGDSDTAPDYVNFLSTLNLETSTNLQHTSSALPKRGNKDFEPHPTNLQTSSLQRSRDAMTQALSHTRTHAPKVHVRGIYDDKSGLTRVGKVKGQMFRSLGRDISGGGADLYAEEALWGLERGALDVFWPKDAPKAQALDGADATDSDAYEECTGLPMSLQAAYAAYVGGPGGLTSEKYVVYAGLKRAGFVVLRAQGFHGIQRRRLLQSAEDQRFPSPGLWAWLRELIFEENQHQKTKRLAIGPLVKPGLYRNYNSIYDMLRIIPAYTPPSSTSTSHASPAPSSTRPTSTAQKQKLNNEEVPKDYETYHTSYTTTYNIYRASPTFRKSAPGAPDFRVCVISARDTSVPTLAELDSLLDEQPQDPPPPQLQPQTPSASRPDNSARGGGRGGRGAGRGRGNGIGGVYNRLKHGQRNVLLAVVDEGVVSYMRVCEAGFTEERLNERVGPPPARGGKGGGQRGGRGGRGRGRGGRGS
ncbi:hypothetical protein FH972_022330 [Carpinus fangiana]|uniref:tRNA-splicing endonuclease subunit Sen54 N-terminal domain-containing protein n=1 Tax=Carpinus fangiana TaxID=176857 RepID=A0A5N6KSA2_9ROSI|nr:hypothetical protein FH972_022330 [Carpinus fangiana]